MNPPIRRVGTAHQRFTTTYSRLYSTSKSLRECRATATKLGASLIIALVTVHSATASEDAATASTSSEPKPSVIADAAEAKRWDEVRTLCASKTEPVDQPQPDGMTALHWGVYHNELSIVDLLLKADAAPTAATDYEVTPLQIACEMGHAEITTRLLKSGADANVRFPGEVTPLMYAARAGAPAVAKTLLEHGADVNATEDNNQTALMWAASRGNSEVVTTLVEAGADVEAASRTGFTSLMYAARDGHPSVVQELYRAGADINAVIKGKPKGRRAPRGGSSALTFAVESGHFELAMLLIRCGASPNDQRSGFTPLHSLSWVRKPSRGEEPDGDPPPRGSGRLTSLQFVREIVAAGADVNARLKKGRSGRATLSHEGATPFLLAGKTADLPFLKLLLELGADPTITNVDGCNALMAAAGVGVKAVGEEAGTEPEVIRTIEYLADIGLDVNSVDENRETAMHGAGYRNFPKVVDCLARLGADSDKWNHKNKWGWTPIMIAEGHRPGSFKPSPVTVAAMKKAMKTRKDAIPVEK